jgi:hypothetical protein
VVVPAWTEAERLPRLLDALERCDPPPHEVIVADGGSEDGTAGLAAGRATVTARRAGEPAERGCRVASGDALRRPRRQRPPAFGSRRSWRVARARPVVSIAFRPASGAHPLVP